MKRVVIASNNPAKIRELASLLLRHDIEAVPQSQLGVAEAAEPHATFLENALAKARHASLATGLAALADDSGLCVPAIGGEPGVHSACYAGTEGPREGRDARNNAKLVGRLRGVADRSAYFYCVLVLLRSADDPCPVVADGVWHGEIILEPRGSHGFGYDPHFFLPGPGLAAAELYPEEKNRASHRGKAMAALAERIESFQAAGED